LNKLKHSETNHGRFRYLLVWALPENNCYFTKEAAKFPTQSHCIRITQKH